MSQEHFYLSATDTRLNQINSAGSQRMPCNNPYVRGGERVDNIVQEDDDIYENVLNPMPAPVRPPTPSPANENISSEKNDTKNEKLSSKICYMMFAVAFLLNLGVGITGIILALQVRYYLDNEDKFMENEMEILSTLDKRINESKIDNNILHQDFSTEINNLTTELLGQIKDLKAEISFFNTSEILLNQKVTSANGSITGLQKQLDNIAKSAVHVRLAGGNSSRSGRVEVFHNGLWGTICDDIWHQNNANVVCRMLGFGDASAYPGSAAYGRGSGKIWLDEVSCIGSETNIFLCRHNGWGINNCGHSEDASVVCT